MSGFYIWLMGHPNEKPKPQKTFTRVPIPPGREFRDRKNDYIRQPKRPNKGE